MRLGSLDTYRDCAFHDLVVSAATASPYGLEIRRQLVLPVQSYVMRNGQCYALTSEEAEVYIPAMHEVGLVRFDRGFRSTLIMQDDITACGKYYVDNKTDLLTRIGLIVVSLLLVIVINIMLVCYTCRQLGCCCAKRSKKH